MNKSSKTRSLAPYPSTTPRNKKRVPKWPKGEKQYNTYNIQSKTTLQTRTATNLYESNNKYWRLKRVQILKPRHLSFPRRRCFHSRSSIIHISAIISYLPTVITPATLHLFTVYTYLILIPTPSAMRTSLWTTFLTPPLSRRAEPWKMIATMIYGLRF